MVGRSMRRLVAHGVCRHRRSLRALISAATARASTTALHGSNAHDQGEAQNMPPQAILRGTLAIVEMCCSRLAVWRKCVGPAQSLQSPYNPGFRHRPHAVAPAVRAQIRKTTMSYLGTPPVLDF